MTRALPSDYELYLGALAKLCAAPEDHAGALRDAAVTYDRSVNLVNNALAEAAKRHEGGIEAVSRHLQNARSFVAKVGEQSRVPPRIKPSAVPTSATSTEVDAALQDLGQATIQLGRAVERAHAARMSVPAPVPSQEPSQEPSPSASPRRPTLAFAVGAALVIAAIVIIYLVAVVH